MIKLFNLRKDFLKMKPNEKIRMLRESIDPKPSQTKIAEKLNIGQMTLSRIESGANEPNLKTLKAICELYNVSADYILGIIDKPRKIHDDK